jgi:tRNA-dihydrouridine synthase B
VKTRVRIPLIANGDITTPQKAKFVLDYTGADGVMVGRAAQGRPWIFREIEHFLKTGKSSPAAGLRDPAGVPEHLADLYAFYGEDTGVKIARKHISWYQGPGRLGPVPQDHEHPADRTRTACRH